MKLDKNLEDETPAIDELTDEQKARIEEEKKAALARIQARKSRRKK